LIDYCALADLFAIAKGFKLMLAMPLSSIIGSLSLANYRTEPQPADLDINPHLRKTPSAAAAKTPRLPVRPFMATDYRPKSSPSKSFQENEPSSFREVNTTRLWRSKIEHSFEKSSSLRPRLPTSLFR